MRGTGEGTSECPMITRFGKKLFSGDELQAKLFPVLSTFLVVVLRTLVAAPSSNLHSK